MKDLKPAWISPSNFEKLMAPKGLGKVAQDYADEVVLQMFGIYKPSFTSAPTSWGINQEPVALERYSVETLTTVEKVNNSITHPTVEYVKGKPDALIWEIDGIVEVKCPYNPIGHLNTLREAVPEVEEKPSGYMGDYWWQVQGYLWITGRMFCDFVSFDPRFDLDEQIVIQKVFPNEKDIKLLAERCEEFWALVASKIPEKYKPV
jgi:hypothetical protein